MLVLLHVVIGCGILFRFKVYQNLYWELKSSPLFPCHVRTLITLFIMENNTSLNELSDGKKRVFSFISHESLAGIKGTLLVVFCGQYGPNDDVLAIYTADSYEFKKTSNKVTSYYDKNYRSSYPNYTAHVQISWEDIIVARHSETTIRDISLVSHLFQFGGETWRFVRTDKTHLDVRFIDESGRISIVRCSELNLSRNVFTFYDASYLGSRETEIYTEFRKRLKADKTFILNAPEGNLIAEQGAEPSVYYRMLYSIEPADHSLCDILMGDVRKYSCPAPAIDEASYLDDPVQFIWFEMSLGKKGIFSSCHITNSRFHIWADTIDLGYYRRRYDSFLDEIYVQKKHIFLHKDFKSNSAILKFLANIVNNLSGHIYFRPKSWAFKSRPDPSYVEVEDGDSLTFGDYLVFFEWKPVEKVEYLNGRVVYPLKQLARFLNCDVVEEYEDKFSNLEHTAFDDYY